MSASKFVHSPTIPTSAAAGKLWVSDANGKGSWSTLTITQFFHSQVVASPKIVFGAFQNTGATLMGTGWSCVKNSTGNYTVTLADNFAANEVAGVANAYANATRFCRVDPSYTGATILCYTDAGALIDSAITFILIGPE